MPLGNQSGNKLIEALQNHTSFRAIMQRYGVNTCYLFGSRSAGSAHSQSDVDLAVLFTDYDPSRHNLDQLIELESDLTALLAPVKVDVVGLQRIRDIALRFEIISTGVVLYCADHDQRTDFEEIVLRDYQDFKPVLDLYYREMEEAVFGH